MCLNDTAAWLWEKASEMGEFSVDGLVEALFEEFEVTKEQALQDVKDIVAKWEETGILE
jgi:hypothetical protein